MALQWMMLIISDYRCRSYVPCLRTML